MATKQQTTTLKRKGKQPTPPPKTLVLKPRSHQPSKREREEASDMPGMTEDQLRDTFMRPFRVVEKP